jgi:hypothetical protein
MWKHQILVTSNAWIISHATSLPSHHTVNYRHAHLTLLSSKFHTTLGNCSKCDTQTGGLPLLENSEVCTEICKLSLLSKYTRSPLWMHLLTEYNSPIQSAIPSGNNCVLARASHSLKQEITVGPYKLPATLLLSFIISWAQDVCRWKLRTMEWSTTCPFYWVRCQVSPLGARVRPFHYTL